MSDGRSAESLINIQGKEKQHTSTAHKDSKGDKTSYNTASIHIVCSEVENMTH